MRAPKSMMSSAVRKDSAQFAAICRELLQKGFSVRFTAQGESMRPNILPNDQVLVAPASANELKPGQVVLAQSQEGLRVHRVIERLAEGSAAITRGDAGQEADATEQQILGKVVAIARDGEEISTDRPWSTQVHAARTWLRKLRLAGRRRLTRGFLAAVPAFILLQLFAGAAAMRANNVPVTITQTPSVTTVSPGGQITYTDVLVNTNNTASTHAPVITQPIPTNTTYVSIVAPTGFNCTTGAVGSGTSVVCTDTVNFPANGTATLMVTVQVKATTAGQTVLNANNTPTVTPAADYTVTTNIVSTVTVLSADLSLTQTAAPTTVSPGGTITFTNTITNVTGGTGGSSAAAPQVTFATPTNTTFTSASGTGYTCTGVMPGATGTETCMATGPLAIGGTSTITIIVAVNAGVAGQTAIMGSATVSSATFDPVGGNNTGTSTSTVLSASLAITEAAAPAAVAPGGTLTFTSVVTNSGASASATPQLTFTIPTNTTYVSGTGSGYTCTGVAVGATGTLTCTTAANLANGGSSTIAIVVTVSTAATNGTVIGGGGAAGGTATVTSTTFDPNSANNTASASATVQAADLSMTQTAAPNPVATGANITYTETVTNNSAQPAVGATLTQSTPANTTFASATPPTGWTCGTVPAVGATGTITCTANATLAGGSTSGNFSIAVTVNAAAIVGSTITNTATVSETGTDPVPGNNTTTTSVTVSGADLAMTQTASVTAVAAGSPIMYTETVTNNGPNAAVGATLYQQTPTNTVFSSMTPPANWTCGTTPAVGGTGQVICTANANVNSGVASGNFTYAVTVSAGTAAGTTITNTADVTSQTSDSTPSNNVTTTSVLVEVTGDADMALSMTAAPTPVFVSSPLSYTIQVQNLGLAAGTAVTVTDTLPATLTGASATTTQELARHQRVEKSSAR